MPPRLHCGGPSDIAKIARGRLRRDGRPAASAGVPDERCGSERWRAARAGVLHTATLCSPDLDALASLQQGSPPSSQAPRRERSRSRPRAAPRMGDLDLPDFIDEELLDADEDFDDERAGKRRKLEPEEEQRQRQQELLEQARCKEAERQMQASHAVRLQFLHYARLNGIAQQDQVEILDELSEAPRMRSNASTSTL